jgi:nitrite reductase (NO-forming)/hydroxylamine reductase
MRKNWFVMTIVIVLITAFLLAGCTSGETEIAAGDEPLIQEKPVSAYFMDSCSGCHGPTRQGATGPALLPQRLDQTDEYYIDVILNGKPGTVMPPWSSVLSDEDATALVTYVRSEPEEGALTWTMDDIKGSLQEIIAESDLPAAPTHSGNLENLMLVTEREVQSITVIDGDTHTLLAHIPASYRAHGYTFDPVDERWAYNMGRDGWVFKIDLYGLQPVSKVRVGLDSRGIAMSDDGQYIIIGNYIPATAVILNADTLEPLKVISTQAENPEGEMVDSRVAIVSDVSPDLVGPYFIIALKEAGQMWRIDWSDPGFSIAKVENVGHILHDGFLSPDNTKFYIASQTDNWMAVIDVADWKLIEQIETGDTPHPGSGASWEMDGVTYGATVHAAEGKATIWDMATNKIVGSVDTAGAGLFIRASDHSPYVWADAVFAAEPNKITVFEKTPPFNVVGTIDDGLRTVHPEFTADGAFVYISDWDGNVVRIYDAETLALAAEIDGVTTPTGIFNTDRRHETLGH